MAGSVGDRTELLSMLDQVRGLLSQNTKVSEYFRSELEWIKRREALWQRDTFRIGLLGITSSGKSTLVNALLNAKLLPDAVRPSSNSLVVCEWGEQFESVVYFKDISRRAPKILKGNNVGKEISFFADEKTNPGNHEGIEEIRVRSPQFKLGKGIELIDTPGLDAYGYDGHEKLTLEVLLPTVDVVIFLTTCKANSDAKIKEYVSIARDHNKPVIVVQNMIDSVEDKLGGYGKILETKYQVLQKHLSRLQGVLNQAGVNAASINQVSAKWALDGKKNSGLNELVENIKGKLNKLIPAIVNGRRVQLMRWLESVNKNERYIDNPEALTRQYQSDLDSLEQKRSQVDKTHIETIHQFKDVKNKSKEYAETLRKTTGEIQLKAVDEAYKLKTTVENWLKESPSKLRGLNKSLMEKIKKDSDSLNLRMDEIQLIQNRTHTGSGIHIETTEKNKPRLVEQSGFLGWLKRGIDVFDAEWGYDERIERWTEIVDIEKFRKTALLAIDRELIQIDEFIVNVVKLSERVSRQFAEEIVEQGKSIKDKMEHVVDMSQRKEIARQLNKLKIKLTSVSSFIVSTSNPPVVHRFEELQHEMEISPIVEHMISLATHISRYRFLEMREQVIKPLGSSSKSVLIISFDQDVLMDFINRFWFDMIEPNASEPSKKFKLIKLQNKIVDKIAAAHFSDADNDPRELVKDFLIQSGTLFLIIDIQQIGGSKSLLDRSKIPLQHKNLSIIVVIQSIAELKEANTIAEALFQLKEAANEIGFKINGVLVNSEQTHYSILANWLVVQSCQSMTLKDEREFLQLLAEDDREEAGGIIRSWKNQISAPQ